MSSSSAAAPTDTATTGKRSFSYFWASSSDNAKKQKQPEVVVKNEPGLESAVIQEKPTPTQPSATPAKLRSRVTKKLSGAQVLALYSGVVSAPVPAPKDIAKPAPVPVPVPAPKDIARPVPVPAPKDIARPVPVPEPKVSDGKKTPAVKVEKKDKTDESTLATIAWGVLVSLGFFLFDFIPDYLQSNIMVSGTPMEIMASTGGTYASINWMVMLSAVMVSGGVGKMLVVMISPWIWTFVQNQVIKYIAEIPWLNTTLSNFFVWVAVNYSFWEHVIYGREFRVHGVYDARHLWYKHLQSIHGKTLAYSNTIPVKMFREVSMFVPLFTFVVLIINSTMMKKVYVMPYILVMLVCTSFIAVQPEGMKIMPMTGATFHFKDSYDFLWMPVDEHNFIDWLLHTSIVEYSVALFVACKVGMWAINRVLGRKA